MATMPEWYTCKGCDERKEGNAPVGFCPPCMEKRDQFACALLSGLASTGLPHRLVGTHDQESNGPFRLDDIRKKMVAEAFEVADVAMTRRSIP